MSDVTISNGLAGESDTVWFNWFDHNGIDHENKVEFKMLSDDKPRTLQILIDNKPIKTIEASGDYNPDGPSPVKIKWFSGEDSRVEPSKPQENRARVEPSNCQHWPEKKCADYDKGGYCNKKELKSSAPLGVAVRAFSNCPFQETRKEAPGVWNEFLTELDKTLDMPEANKILWFIRNKLKEKGWDIK